MRFTGLASKSSLRYELDQERTRLYIFGFSTVTSQKGEGSCICVLGVSILPFFYDFDIRFWNCSATLILLVFHLLLFHHL